MRLNNIADPESRLSDSGLLLLRAGLGFSLFFLFGLPKLKDALNFLHTGHWSFVDFNRKVGLPAPVLIACLQSVNESACALLVACGSLTRYAAGCLFFGFSVAVWCSLKMHEEAWLTAAYFALMSATIVLTGPGKFSIDGLLQSWTGAKDSNGGARSHEIRK